MQLFSLYLMFNFYASFFFLAFGVLLTVAVFPYFCYRVGDLYVEAVD